MVELAAELHTVSLEDELTQSYLDYAMSVIIGRALPDVRDGLKPVHRRILYAMNELGNSYGKPYKKSARIVGDVIGKYHPHGDVAVYDSIVRMAQDFSMRYTLIDGQGNFGSIDGDPPAAMRYTEIRMAKITQHLLADLDKNTVDFQPNYDETETLPEVLPTKVPNLLINGSAGIAVGMATNIPPHNLKEVINGCIAYLENPDISILELMQYIPAPDFPTAGIIIGKKGIIQAYHSGKGKVCLRSRTAIEDLEKGNKQAIIVTELPYQVNKARLIEHIAELVKDKRIEGISALRDESDKDGIRIVIEIKRGDSAETVLNNLYLHTQLQISFSMNMVALVNNEPKLLTLKNFIKNFINHRLVVVSRRTEYELAQSKERAHILEGLSIALVNIDQMITLIKASKNAAEALQALMLTSWPITEEIKAVYKLIDQNAYMPVACNLTTEQAQAILDLKLQRLTNLEQDKIWQELKLVMEKIVEYQSILANHEKLIAIVKQELLDIKTEFSDERKSQLVDNEMDFIPEELITAGDMVVTLSYTGYIKTQPLSIYTAQHRGGRGKIATSVKSEDFIFKLLIANTHDTLLCFSNFGKVYWLKVHQIPTATRIARGTPIVNMLSLQKDERISTILPIKDFTAEKTIFMATAYGSVKQVDLRSFANQRQSGIIAINLVDGDSLIGAELTTNDQEIMLFSNAGKAIRFKADDIRNVGRTAKGVRGIKLKKDQKLISLIVVKPEGTILTAASNGIGKRTNLEEFSIIARGGQGVIAMQTKQDAQVIGALQVNDDDELLLITDQGTLIRTKVAEISVVGRNTKGVNLINLNTDEHLVAIEKVADC